MSPQSLENLKLLLMAGLDRGLLAWWRAWVPTLRIYQDGIKEGLWPKLAWVEEILSDRKPGETIERTTFRYLDARFTHPKEKYSLFLSWSAR